MAQIKKSERRYVAISHLVKDHYTHKACLFVAYVGCRGESSHDVYAKALDSYIGKSIEKDTMAKNTIIVTEAAAKRSYRKAWNDYQQEQEENRLQALADEQLYDTLVKLPSSPALLPPDY